MQRKGGVKGIVVGSMAIIFLVGSLSAANILRENKASGIIKEEPSGALPIAEPVEEDLAAAVPIATDATAKASPISSIEKPADTKPESSSSGKPPEVAAPQKSEEQKLAEAERAAGELQKAVQNLQTDLSDYQESVLEHEKTPSFSPADFTVATSKTREAVVNILCESKIGGTLNPLSASGVVIDSRGIILTNAHVAQYFLLKDYLVQDFIDCTIRIGSPAQHRYRAELVYISPTWVKNNAEAITEENPLGTGEFDFALLAITSTTNPEGILPSSFPYLPFKTDLLPTVGENVLLSAYPSGFLGGITVQTGLYQLSSIGTVSSLYTFDETYIDVLEVEGSLLSQKGSSGGALVSGDGELLGLIATALLDAKSTKERSVRAITTDHIDRKFEGETGKRLSAYMDNDIGSLIRIFEPQFAPLRNSLIEAIENN